MISSNNSIQGKVGSNKLQGFGVHARGPEGNGIEKIELTNTVDLIDTYTITFTNGKTTTFEVHNGKDGANGINGENGKPLEFNWQGTSLGVRVEGTEEYVYIDLQGPQGETGPQGPKGETGEQGPKGEAGVEIIDNLESDSTEAGLSARQGKALSERITNVENTKLDKMVVSKELNTAGWYRVAKYNNNGTTSIAFMLNISSLYDYKNNISASMMINITYEKSRITPISTVISYPVITKARIVKENNIYYIEVYYADNTRNPIYIDILNPKGTLALSTLDFEAPTDTATVLDEIDIDDFEHLGGHREPATNANFNDLTKRGVYYFTSIPTGSNKPNTSSSGVLEVFKSNNGNLITQRYTDYTGANTWTRGSYLGSWTSWTAN